MKIAYGVGAHAPPDPNEPLLLSERSVAVELKTTTGVVRRLITEGKLPATWAGVLDGYRVKPEDVLALKANVTVAAVPAQAARS